MILAQERLGHRVWACTLRTLSPEEFAIPRAEMEVAIEAAVREAAEKGFTGKHQHPVRAQENP